MSSRERCGRLAGNQEKALAASIGLKAVQSGAGGGGSAGAEFGPPQKEARLKFEDGVAVMPGPGLKSVQIASCFGCLAGQSLHLGFREAGFHANHAIAALDSPEQRRAPRQRGLH